jgi:hypothetical protein
MRRTASSIGMNEDGGMTAQQRYTKAMFGARPGQGSERERLDSLAKNMLSRKNLARGIGANFSPGERSARMKSRMIQNQRLLAKAYAGLAGREMEGKNRLENTKLAGKNRLDVTGLAGQNQLENTALAGQNRLGAIGLRGKNAIASLNAASANRMNEQGNEQEFKAGQSEKDRDFKRELWNRNFGAKLFELTGSGSPQVDNVINTPAYGPVDTSGLSVRQKPEGPEKGLYQIKEVTDEDGNKKYVRMNTATGETMAVQPNAAGQGFGAGASHGDQAGSEVETGQFDPNNLSPGQAAYLSRLKNEDPVQFKRIVAAMGK